MSRDSHMQIADSTFIETLEHLENGLTVSLIATPRPWMCSEEDQLDGVLKHMEHEDFTQVPVRRDDELVGMLERDHAIAASIKEAMTPLSSSMLVSGSTGLAEVVRTLASGESRYRLVVGSQGIEGIVTRSDLHKLPVRLLSFTFITQLEALMASVVRLRAPDDDEEWLHYLAQSHDWLPNDLREVLGGAVGAKAVKKLYCRQHDMAEKSDAAPSLLELTEFSQKWYVVMQLEKQDEGFARDLVGIQLELRNTIMHSRNYASTDAQLRRFGELMGKVNYWIDELSRVVNTSETARQEP